MNKIKTGFIFILAIICSINANTQSKTLTSEDAVGLNRALFPKTLYNLTWIGNTDSYTYNTAKAVIKQNITSKKTDTIINLSVINSQLKENKKLKYLPFGKWINEYTYLFPYENTFMTYDTKSRKTEILNKYDEKGENVDFNPITYKIAYTINNNLYITSTDSTIQITNEPENIISGQTVHRNEFGITKGTFWSPSGKKLAYYKMDQTMVTDYPLVDINTRTATVTNIKYPMAGMESHQVKLHIYDTETAKDITIKTGKPEDQYLTSVTWDPAEEAIYIGVLNREQNHLKVNKYDSRNGSFIKTLFEEKNPRWVEPEEELYFNPSNPDNFIWFSERDGFKHAYYYNTNGDLEKQLTSGDWMITQFKGYDEKGDNIYYLSTENSPLNQQLYTVNIKTGKKTLLTPGDGTHNPKIQPTGKYIIDQYSSIKAPYIAKINDNTGKTIKTLQVSDDPLADYPKSEITVGKIASSLKDSLYYRIVKPVDFDPTKKYPVIIYVYGGPHLQVITNSWTAGAGLYQLYLASQGYVVFSLDNHGTPNRGFEFESVIHRNLGKQEVDDQMKGVELLQSLPYVDKERIGVDGWSYGGFMTISMALAHPEVFKCATAGGPVCDWSLYEIMYGERYMDTPEENPEGYKNANLIDKIPTLKTKLLVNHGYIDDVVVPQNSLLLIDNAIKNNIPIDFFFYPNHQHNVRGKDRAHLINKIVDYHKQNQ